MLDLSAKDLDVIVVGGGDTGCDCIGTALRQGARSITSFEILPQPPAERAKDNPWPQFPRLFKVSNHALAVSSVLYARMCVKRNKSSVQVRVLIASLLVCFCPG